MIAINAILDSFALEPVPESPMDDEDAVRQLELRGLSVLRVYDATLDTLIPDIRLRADPGLSEALKITQAAVVNPCRSGA